MRNCFCISFILKLSLGWVHRGRRNTEAPRTRKFPAPHFVLVFKDCSCLLHCTWLLSRTYTLRYAINCISPILSLVQLFMCNHSCYMSLQFDWATVRPPGQCLLFHHHCKLIAKKLRCCHKGLFIRLELGSLRLSKHIVNIMQTSNSLARCFVWLCCAYDLILPSKFCNWLEEKLSCKLFGFHLVSPVWEVSV